MSTIACVGSVFDPSSAPCLTMPWPRPPALPCSSEAPTLRTPVSAKIPVWRALTFPPAPARTGWPVLPMTGRRRARLSCHSGGVPIQPLLQVEAALIRRQLPDLLLRPGMTFAARVAERTAGRGIIVLAGAPLVAELPDEVQAGDKLRLLVQ